MTTATARAPELRAPSPAGEEELRFIRNFHDVFLSIGLVIFIAGLAIVSALILGETVNVESFGQAKTAGYAAAAVGLIDAAILWLFAEFFARTRRLFLPAIVILLGFNFFVVGSAFAAYVTLLGEETFENFNQATTQLKFLPATLAGVSTAAIALFYLRMKLPFAMGLGALMLVWTAVSALAATDPARVMEFSNVLMLIAGVFLFLLGVIYDARDPERRGRLSDNGFWLHFFAAPMIFAGAVNLATGGGVFMKTISSRVPEPELQQFAGDPTIAAATTLIIVFLFAVVSLLINRRALLVSGLLSAAFAVAILVNKTGLSGAWTGGLTLLLLGGAMVLLGGGWHWVRRRLVAGVPKTGLIARIIPPEPDPEDARAVARSEEGA